MTDITIDEQGGTTPPPTPSGNGATPPPGNPPASGGTPLPADPSTDADPRTYHFEIFLMAFASLLLEVAYTRVISFKLY